MSSSSDDLILKMQRAANNPMEVARTIITDLEARAEGGVELSNPMNPYVHLVEMASCLGSAQIRTAKALNRRQYPDAANSFEDLYHHMSDADHVDVFAMPASSRMIMLYNKEELLARAIPTGAGNMRKLTIGRDTVFSVAGMDFGIYYPIDIRVMAHGGLQIVYDGSEDNPMQSLESNNVEWAIRNLGRLGGGEMVEIQIPVKQFKATSYKATLNSAAQFKKLYAFEDQFYHCRAYMATRTGEWKEIRTTHSDQIFDPNTPTLQLKLTSNGLLVQLPYVYYSTGLADTELRIDIFTTKGPQEFSLASYAPNSYTVKYQDRNNEAGHVYMTPLPLISTSTCYSDSMVTGGRNAISLFDLKQRIKTNSVGRNTVPVTPAQIETELGKLGFGAVLNVDNITDRVYLATRKLPTPVELLGELANGSVTSAAGSTMMTLTAELDDLVDIAGVLDTGARITLTPDVLYENDNGVLKLVPRHLTDQLALVSRDQLLAEVNSHNYLYSPLHYVLDATGEYFEARPYYFGTPVASNRNFVDDNDTTGIGVNSSKFAITAISGGWRLVVESSSDESYKNLPDDQVHMQIGFEPAAGGGMVYMRGTYLGRNPSNNERMYEFIIGTLYDIDANHHLYLTTFDMLDETRDYPAELTTKFHVFYLAEGVSGLGYQVKWFDQMVGDFQFQNPVSALYYETVDLKFADNLEGLWTRTRTIPGSEDYRRYEEDVIQAYAETVYERDGSGRLVLQEVNGSLQPVVLHQAGDPVLDEDTQEPIVLHRAGEIVVDRYGNPIPVSSRTVTRQMDLFLIDGVYRFVTNPIDVMYAKRLPEALVMWLEEYLTPFRGRLHSKTEVYLHPQSTVGTVTMLVGNGIERQFEAGQWLNVTFHVDAAVYKDLEVRKTIEASTTQTLARLLERERVIRDEVQSTIKSVLGEDVISVEVDGLGGGEGYTTFTALDGGGRLCIGKKLVAVADGSFTLTDTINYQFLRHTL